MKVHAYKLNPVADSQPIEEIFTMIHGKSLTDRSCSIRDQQVRVEEITHHESGVWLLDFVKFRDGHGPGKTHPERKITGFKFDDKEGFGEETAALYDPDTGYFIIQYNHNGIRANMMADYLNVSGARPSHYEMVPKFDDETERRFLSKGFFTRVKAKIAPHYLNPNDKKAGMSFRGALNINSSLGGEKITIAISAKRSKHGCLSPQRVRDFVNDVRKIIRYDVNAVDKLEISGKDGPVGVSEVIDFLGQKLCLEYDIIPGTDKRLPLKERWNSLHSARTLWRKVLK